MVGNVDTYITGLFEETSHPTPGCKEHRRIGKGTATLTSSYQTKEKTCCQPCTATIPQTFSQKTF